MTDFTPEDLAALEVDLPCATSTPTTDIGLCEQCRTRLRSEP